MDASLLSRLVASFACSSTMCELGDGAGEGKEEKLKMEVTSDGIALLLLFWFLYSNVFTLCFSFHLSSSRLRCLDPSKT